MQDLLLQARAAVEKRDYAGAVQPLQGYLAQRPDDATAQFQLAYVYSELERWEEARSGYEKAIGLNPQLAEAYVNLGLILMRTDPAAAVEPLRKAVELRPMQGRPRFLLGTALEKAGKLNEAASEYQEAAKLDGKNFDNQFALGRALLGVGRAAEAEASFREAASLRRDFAPAHLGLAQSLLAQEKQRDAAVEFRAYLELKPEDRGVRLELVELLLDLKRADEALVELDRAETGAQPSLEGLKLRAEALLQSNRIEEGITALEQATAIAPQDAELQARLGRAWLAKREFGKAEGALKTALRINSKLTDALRDLVSVYYLAGQYEGALAMMDLLGQREKLRGGAWFIKATCYDKLGRKREALDAYQDYLKGEEDRDETRDFQARQRIRILARELERTRR